MFYTHEEKLICGFWSMKYKGVPRFEDDILGMKQDGVSTWEMVSLGKLVVCNDLTLTWSFFSLVQNINLPSPIEERGDVIPRHLKHVA